MKRIAILSVGVMMALGTSAQTQAVVKAPNLERLKKDIAKSDEKISEPKKRVKPSTWFDRGEMFMEVYDKATLGAAPNRLEVEYLTLQCEKKNVTWENEPYQVYSLPSIDLYFTTGKSKVLSHWIEKEQAIDNPLIRAADAFDTVVVLDVERSFEKKLKKAFNDLEPKIKWEGVNAYTLQKYKEAQLYFMRATDISLNPYVAKLDSVMAYYAGVVSLEFLKDYANAKKYLNICIDNNYCGERLQEDAGMTYSRLARTYHELGDTAMQEATLLTGFSKYPKSQAVLIELINLKLSSGRDPLEVIPFLKKAQQNEPNNASLYFAEATLYEKLKMPDSAENVYKRAIEVDPSNYNSYYNLGALYYNKAVEYQKQVMDIKDYRDPKIKELKEKSREEFKRALVPFLKAHELNPTDKAAVENVKNIYFMFRDDSPEMMANYNKYDAEFKALK